MRYLLLILVMTGLIYAQEESGTKTYTQEQIIKLANKMKELESTNSSQAEQIETFKELVVKYDNQSHVDSMLIDFQKKQIDILKEREKMYEKQVSLVKPKWYESKYLWYAYGFATVSLSSYIVGNIK